MPKERVTNVQRTKRALCLILTLAIICTSYVSVFARSVSSKPYDPDFHLNTLFGISDLAVTKYDFENFSENTPAASVGFNSINNITDAKIADDNGNKVVCIKSTGSGSAYMKFPIGSLDGLVIIELDLKFINSVSRAQVTAMGKDSAGNNAESVAGVVTSTPQYWAIGAANYIDFSPNEWIRVSMAVDVNESVSDVYFNGELVYNDLPFYADAKNVNSIKFTSQDMGYEYYIDNIRVCSAKDKTVIEDIPDTRPNNSYPAKMLAFSDEEKEMQRRAGEKLQEDINNAIASGETQINVEDGYYRFGRGKYENLTISGASNLKIIGNDVNIIEEAIKKAVVLQNCSNVTIKGFRIDFEPLQISQGTVLSVDRENKTFTFKVDNGYRIPDSGWDNSRLFAYLADGVTVLRKHANDKVSSAVHLGDKVVELSTTLGNLFEDDVPFEPGCRVVIPLRTSGGAVSVENCGNCTLKDVHIYSSPGFGLYEQGGSGANVYDGLRLIRRPGTNRLHASSADGFHSKGCKVGPQLINSELSYAEDDLFNVHGSLDYVYDVIGKNKLLVVGHYGISTDVGTSVDFYDLESYEYKDSANVVSVKKLGDAVYMNNIKDVSSFIGSEYGVTVRTMADGTFDMYEVTLDKDVNVLPYDWYIGTSTSSKNTVIKNTYFHDGPVRGILMRAPDSVIEDCTFENINCSAIFVCLSRYWYEGPIANNLTIKNNVFKNIVCGVPGSESSMAAIQAITERFTDRKEPFETTHYSNINITGNTIEHCQTAAIALINTKDSAVTGNTIIAPFTDWYNNPKVIDSESSVGIKLKGFNSAIFSEYSKNVVISGNTFENIPDNVANVTTNFLP